MSQVRRHSYHFVGAAVFVAAFLLCRPCAAETLASGLPTGDMDWAPAEVVDGAFTSGQVRPDSLSQLAGAGAPLATSPDSGGVSAQEGAAFGVEYTPWQKRRGPAYPDDKWRSVGRDLQELPETLWDDTKYAACEPIFWVGMGVAGVSGLVIHKTGVDGTIADRTKGHQQLSSEVDGIGGFFGSPAVHLPLSALMYTTGLVVEDVKLYETSKALFNALALNGITVEILKIACQTDSPNGDPLGWPSGHTSSSFCFATVMAEAYGPWVGVPLFAFAGFVGWERIDARNHDFSDVISGMVMGITWGYVVSENHKPRMLGMDIEPMVDPATQSVGLALVKRW